MRIDMWKKCQNLRLSGISKSPTQKSKKRCGKQSARIGPKIDSVRNSGEIGWFETDDNKVSDEDDYDCEE